MEGKSYSSWEEYLKDEIESGEIEALDDESPENVAWQTESDARKLPYKHKDLFGYTPQYDFQLVVCKVCGMRIKPQALLSHMEKRHKNVSQDQPSSGSVQENSYLTSAASTSKVISDKEIRLTETNSKTASSVAKTHSYRKISKRSKSKSSLSIIKATSSKKIPDETKSETSSSISKAPCSSNIPNETNSETSTNKNIITNIKISYTGYYYDPENP